MGRKGRKGIVRVAIRVWVGKVAVKEVGVIQRVVVVTVLLFQYILTRIVMIIF